MTCMVLLELKAKAGTGETLVGVFKQILPETRAYDGCIGVDVYRNQDDKDVVVLVEQWESRAKYEKYFAWREETGAIAQMGEMIELTAQDGHVLGAYVARPAGPARAGLVVVQEIFGVNGHMRDVADGFAREGYLAIAPALFDRLERGTTQLHDFAAMFEDAADAFQVANRRLVVLDVVQRSGPAVDHERIGA